MAKGMSKDKAHKQAIAACMSKTDGDQSKMGGCMSEWKQKHPKGRTKATMEGITFTEFLAEMDQDVRSFIRSMPMYQELLKDQQFKPQAMTLARSLANEFANEQMTPDIRAYIEDEFDSLYGDTAGRHGSNVGDWEGEKAYQQRMQQDKDIDSAMSKWERTTGMDAETGADVSQHDNRGRLKHGARSGMDFRPEIKQQRIAQELRGMGDERQVVQKRASQGLAPGNDAYMGGVSKSQMAKKIVSDGIQAGKRPAEIKAQLRSELDMTGPGANTYYYKYKKQALGGA